MNELISEDYIVAARAHGVASVKGDHKKANEAYDRLITTLNRLRQTPDKGAIVLKEILKNKDAHVRCWAATHLLPLDETIAVHTLEQLAADSESLAGFDAKMVLREWRAGRLKVD